MQEENGEWVWAKQVGDIIVSKDNHSDVWGRVVKSMEAGKDRTKGNHGIAWVWAGEDIEQPVARKLSEKPATACRLHKRALRAADIEPQPPPSVWDYSGTCCNKGVAHLAKQLKVWSNSTSLKTIWIHLCCCWCQC